MVQLQSSHPLHPYQSAFQPPLNCETPSPRPSYGHNHMVQTSWAASEKAQTEQERNPLTLHSVEPLNHHTPPLARNISYLPQHIIPSLITPICIT